MKTVLTALTVFLLIAQVNRAWAVHESGGGLRCLDCHNTLPFRGRGLSFREGTEHVCAGCHKRYHGKTGDFSHPIGMVTSMPVPMDMPLDGKGRIICITCHTFHKGYKDADGKRAFFLRRAMGRAFCYSCHKKPLAMLP
jgi:Doubled CXXCH motif (Paired_CXXCH_1)